MPRLAQVAIIVSLVFNAGVSTNASVVAEFAGSNSHLFFTAGNRIYSYDRSTSALEYFDASGLGDVSLRELAFDDDNNLYAACFGGSNVGILKFARDGQSVSNFVPKTSDEEYWGIAFDNSGDLYASQGDVIRKFDITGALLAELNDTRLDEPRGLAFDTQGHLLIANSGGSEVLIYDDTFNYLGEVSLTTHVWGIAVKPDGRVYVASGNQGNFINVYAASFSFLSTISHADLTEPAQVAFDDAGSLFASSTNLPKLVVFDASDDYSTSLNGAFPHSLGVAFDRITADPFVLPTAAVPEVPGGITSVVVATAGVLYRRRTSNLTR